MQPSLAEVFCGWPAELGSGSIVQLLFFGSNFRERCVRDTSAWIDVAID